MKPIRGLRALQDVLRLWFGTGCDAAGTGARPPAPRLPAVGVSGPAEDTAAGATGEQVIAEAEAILESIEANCSEACRDEVTGAA